MDKLLPSAFFFFFLPFFFFGMFITQRFVKLFFHPLGHQQIYHISAIFGIPKTRDFFFCFCLFLLTIGLTSCYCLASIQRGNPNSRQNGRRFSTRDPNDEIPYDPEGSTQRPILRDIKARRAIASFRRKSWWPTDRWLVVSVPILFPECDSVFTAEKMYDNELATLDEQYELGK